MLLHVLHAQDSPPQQSDPALNVSSAEVENPTLPYNPWNLIVCSHCLGPAKRCILWEETTVTLQVFENLNSMSASLEIFLQSHDAYVRSKQQPGRLARFLPSAQRYPWLLAVSPPKKCLCFSFRSFNSSLQILAYDRPIRSKNFCIGGCDMAVIGVFVLYALIKSVFKPALQLTICSCTFILSSELRWLVSSHFMYYKVCCGCRVSQFSMFLIENQWTSLGNAIPFSSPSSLVNIIVSSLLKLVFRVNKEKSHLFSSSRVLRMTLKCTAFFKGQRITFQVRGRRCFILFTQVLVVTQLSARAVAHWDLFLELSWDSEICIFSPDQNIVSGEHCFYIQKFVTSCIIVGY